VARNLFQPQELIGQQIPGLGRSQKIALERLVGPSGGDPTSPRPRPVFVSVHPDKPFNKID
jgi:hypothetical protein